MEKVAIPKVALASTNARNCYSKKITKLIIAMAVVKGILGSVFVHLTQYFLNKNYCN